MKNNRCGQASLLTDVEYSKLRKQLKTQKYKLLLDLAWYSGERWGAIIQLKVSDVYNSDGSPRETITFRASTRKARPDGSRETRQVPVHPVLNESLGAYQPPGDSVWLFPSRDGQKPITWRNGYDILQRACEKCGFSAKGISTHSTRRSFITKLHKNGASPYTIKKITGHRDYKALERYIDIDSEQIKGAIATL
jgi:integrase/recombinase XerD